jgi:hypothetical protein
MSDIVNDGNAIWQKASFSPPPNSVVAHIQRSMQYDIETGALTWRDGQGPYNRSRDGLVGTVRRDGYRIYKRDRTAIPVSRIAFFLGTGSWPVGVVRFANSDPTDFSLDNLVDLGADFNSPRHQEIMRRIEKDTQEQRRLLWQRGQAQREAEDGLYYLGNPMTRERAIANEIHNMDTYAASSIATLMGNVVPEAERRSRAEAICDDREAQRANVDLELKRMGFNPPADRAAAFKLLLLLL